MDPRELLTTLHTAERLKDATRHCFTSGGRRESSSATGASSCARPLPAARRSPVSSGAMNPMWHFRPR